MKQILIALALLLFLPFAQANESPLWYIKVGTGLNYITLPQDSYEVIEADTGRYINFTAAYQFQQNIHAEIDLSYRRNKGYCVVVDALSLPITGQIHTSAGLVNIVLDFPFQDIFVFSIGGGVGTQRTKGTLKYNCRFDNFTKDLPDFRYHKEGICSQGSLRIMARFTERFGICGEYKHLVIPCGIRHSTVGVNFKLDF